MAGREEEITDGTPKFWLEPVALCALVGGVVAFVASGAIIAVLWTAVGAGLGGIVGLVIERFAQDAHDKVTVEDLTETRTQVDLRAEAAELEIEGRSGMNTAEHAQVIVDRRRDN